MMSRFPSLDSVPGKRMGVRRGINATKRAAVGAVLAAIGAVAWAGCGSSNDDRYYCDNAGCYQCDAYGCSTVAPPSKAACTGASSCAAGSVCTATGCTSTCSDGVPCAKGEVCKAGLCSAPAVDPGAKKDCSTKSDCGDGKACALIDAARKVKHCRVSVSAQGRYAWGSAWCAGSSAALQAFRRSAHLSYVVDGQERPASAFWEGLTSTCLKRRVIVESVQPGQAHELKLITDLAEPVRDGQLFAAGHYELNLSVEAR